MSRRAYSQQSRDRAVASVIVVLPVLALLGVIRYFQRPSDSSPAAPL